MTQRWMGFVAVGLLVGLAAAGHAATLTCEPPRCWQLQDNAGNTLVDQLAWSLCNYVPDGKGADFVDWTTEPTRSYHMTGWGTESGEDGANAKRPGEPFVLGFSATNATTAFGGNAFVKFMMTLSWPTYNGHWEMEATGTSTPFRTLGLVVRLDACRTAAPQSDEEVQRQADAWAAEHPKPREACPAALTWRAAGCDPDQP